MCSRTHARAGGSSRSGQSCSRSSALRRWRPSRGPSSWASPVCSPPSATRCSAWQEAAISAVLYAVGPAGHLLYVVYLIAPLQAALYLGQTEAWQALLVNLTGFGLATAVRVSQGTPGWTWSAFAQETLLLAFVGAALVPPLARFVIRLQAARSTLAQVERGDLTVKLQDEELDELGYLGAVSP